MGKRKRRLYVVEYPASTVGFMCRSFECLSDAIAFYDHKRAVYPYACTILEDFGGGYEKVLADSDLSYESVLVVAQRSYYDDVLESLRQLREAGDLN